MASLGVASGGAAGVLGAALEGVATAEGSAGGSALPPHAVSVARAAREAKIVTVLSSFRMTVR